MRDALIDASIMAGVAFFATLGGVAIAIGATPLQTVTAAAVAAGSEFCAILAMKRGLLKNG